MKIEYQRPKEKTISIDIETDEGELLNDVSDYGDNNPLEVLTKRESVKILRNIIRKALTKKEQIIITRLLNGDSQKEISTDLNVTHQNINQIYKKAIQKIRKGFSPTGYKVVGVLDLRSNGERVERATEKDSVHCAFNNDFKCKDCGKRLKNEGSIYCKDCLIK